MAESPDLSKHNLRHTASDRSRHLFQFNFLYLHDHKCQSDLYNKSTNPEGYVSMGAAVNRLCEDLLEERLTADDVLKYTKGNQHYFPFHGSPHVRDVVAEFLTDHFRSHKSVDPENVVICSGLTGALDCLAHVVAEPGDSFLVPSPIYSGIQYGVQRRSLIDLEYIQLSSKIAAGEKPFELTPEKVESALLNAKKKGKTVKGIVLVNPNNPLGTILASNTLSEILKVCKKYELHVISDEVYALSIVNDQTRFTSILELPELPDPMRTHLVYGLSKDFGLSGLRVGIFHTFNPVILTAMQTMQNMASLPSVMHDTIAKLLGDKEWINTRYLPTNQRLLRESYDVAKTRLNSLGVSFIPVDAGLFVWVDFRKYLKEQTVEEEIDLFCKLMDDAKLYIIPGKEMACSEPGWFRIVFALPTEILHKGFDRLENFLKNKSF